MSTSYDALPAPLPSGSHIPRRPSGSYSHSYDRPAHSGPMTPPESRRVSYPYESSSSSFYRSPNVLHSEPFHDHRGSYSGGVHERYRVPPPSSRYPRDHDSRYISSPNSSRDRDSSSSRKDSTVGRVSQPSDNWKHSNGTDVERRNSMDRSFKLSSPGRIASAEFHGRAHDRDVYTSKASRPSGPAFQERHVRRDSFTSDARDRYNTYRPYDDPSRLYSNSEGYGSRNSRRNLSRSRSFSRSPVRRYSPRPRSRSWSRSKSRSRSPTVSRSRSRSLSRSRSRSPPRRSRLPPRDVDSDAPDHVRSTGSWSRDRNRGISAHTLDKKPVPGPQPHSPKTSARRTIDRASSSFDVIHSRSRSPSHSSIASSRESSVKPCPAPMDEDIIARDSHTEHQPLDGSLQTEVVKTAVTSVTAEYIPQEPDSAGSRLDTSLVSEPASDSQSVGQQPSSGSIKPNEVTKTPPDSSFFKDLSNTVAADIQNSQLVDLSMIQELQGQQSRARPDQAVNSIGKKSPPDEVITTPRDPIAAPSPIVLSRFSKPPIPEFSPSDIPDIKQVKNLQEALRSVVMTRLLADRQTNEERVEPVLSSNLALPKSSFEAPIPGASVQDVMTELSHPQSARVKARSETAEKIRGSLVERFEERQRNFKEKVQRLTKQYVNLHDKWVAHCTMLDKQAKGKSTALTTDDRASTLALSAPPVTGRTTRRSAATLGDAVRSDLEMEQIIASLNNEASDPNQLCLRNVATIPDMISVTKGKVDHVYDDNNLRVDNPSEYYAPQTGIHDWTEEEKRIFQDKFALFPKQFGAIARFLPNKTASQCVEFYYLHKKVDIDFRNVVAMRAPGRRGKRKSTKRKANALLADIRKHDAEVSESVAGTARGAGGKGKGRRGAAVPAVSVNPAPAPTPVPIPTPVPAVEVKKPSSRRPVAHLESTPTTDTPTPEPEGKSRRRRGAGNRTSIGAAIDGDDDATEEPEARPAKRARRGGRKVLKSAAIVSDDGADDSTPPAVPEDMFSDRDAISRRKLWSDEDSNLFLKLLGQHGDDFKRIAASMPNKTTGQVYAYFKVNLVSMGLDKIVENAPRRSVSPVQAPETVQQVVASAPTPTTEEPDEVPPMASLPLDESRSDTVSSPKPGTPTPHAPENPVASYRDFVNAPAFPTMAAPSGEMATLYTHTSGYGDSRFPRYTTGVAAYGAPPMAMSSLYAAQGYVSAAPGFGPPPTGYPPPPGSAPSTTSIATYAPNGGYASARHYLPYAYPYQTSYPIMTGHPPPAPTPPLGSSSSPAPGVNPYTHALGDPRPFYPYSS